VDTSFARGVALGAWLAGADAGIATQVTLTGVASSVGTVTDAAQRWIYDDSTGDTKVMTIVTPIDATDAGDAGVPNCGKALFTDIHSGAGPQTILGGSTPSVPGSCPVGATRTQQQAALEFLFFDLSGCISEERLPPPPLPVSL
jgi:hypothetical protein